MESRSWWKRGKQATASPTSEGSVSIECLAISEEQLPTLFRVIAERTPTGTWGMKRSPAIEAVLARAVAPHTLTADGSLTRPHSYGVYEVRNPPAGVTRYRFGNHPVRMRELIAEHQAINLIATFLTRDDALALAHLLREEEG